MQSRKVACSISSPQGSPRVRGAPAARLAGVHFDRNGAMEEPYKLAVATHLKLGPRRTGAIRRRVEGIPVGDVMIGMKGGDGLTRPGC